VSGHPADLLSRHGGRLLLNPSAKAAQRVKYFVFIGRRGNARFADFSLNVIRIGHRSKRDLSPVTLLACTEKLCQPRRRPCNEHEQARGQWIERAEVSGTPGICQPSPPVHDIVAGQPLRFIYKNSTVHGDLLKKFRPRTRLR
jgi:hypothetical protein